MDRGCEEPNQGTRTARAPTQARTHAPRRSMTKTGATLTAHHVGAREVAFTHLKHHVASVCANSKAALEYANKRAHCAEPYFTARDTEAAPTPAFAFHLVQPEWNRHNAHCKSYHLCTDFREAVMCRTTCGHHSFENEIKPADPCLSSHATER